MGKYIFIFSNERPFLPIDVETTELLYISWHGAQTGIDWSGFIKCKPDIIKNMCTY